MIVTMEVAGWLLFAVTVAGIFLNFALSRRNPDHRPGAATRQILLGCMVVGSAMLALVYTLAALGVADALIDSGRRGRSLWVPATIFVLAAGSGLLAWRRGARSRSRGVHSRRCPTPSHADARTTCRPFASPTNSPSRSRRTLNTKRGQR